MKGKKSKLTEESIKNITALVEQAISNGNIDEAEELAQSIGRKITNEEATRIAKIQLGFKNSFNNILSIAQKYKLPKDLLEKLIKMGVKSGSAWRAHDSAVVAKRLLTQDEVDVLYLLKLKEHSKEPKSLKDSIHNLLYFHIRTDNRKMQTLIPSQKVSNKIVRFCLKHDLLKTGFDVCWVCRGEKVIQVKQSLIDQLVMKRYALEGYSVDTSTKEVVAMASSQVIVKLTKETIAKTDELYKQMLVAECDTSGKAIELVIENQIEKTASFKNAYGVSTHLKTLTEEVVRRYQKNITISNEVIEKLIEVNKMKNCWYENFLLALHIDLPEATRDAILRSMRIAEMVHRTYDLFVKRGGPNDVKEWLIKTFSRKYEIMHFVQFEPAKVAKLGGSEALNTLIDDLLKEGREIDARDTAKLPGVSKKKREMVIKAMLEKYWALHMVKDLVALNKRKLTQAEIDTLFQKNVEKFKTEDYNLHSNADDVINLLKLKPTDALIEIFIKSMKEKKMHAKLVSVLTMLGKEVTI